MTEYVYHVDEEDNVIGKVTRKEMVEANLKHRTIAILVFNTKGEILVMKRSMKKDKDPGQFEVNISGVVDYGEDYDESAIRELKEELGIDETPEYIFKIRTRHSFMNVYRIITDQHIKMNESEIEMIHYTSMKKLPEEMENNEFRYFSYDISEKYNQKND